MICGRPQIHRKNDERSWRNAAKSPCQKWPGNFCASHVMSIDFFEHFLLCQIDYQSEYFEFFSTLGIFCVEFPLILGMPCSGPCIGLIHRSWVIR